MGNIDHVVVAETGVFLLETKAHGGKVSVATGGLLVNGHSSREGLYWPDLAEYLLAQRFEKISKRPGLPWINPVIVFTSAFVEPGMPIKGVTVTNKKFLLKTIDRLGRRTTRISRFWSMRDKLAGLTP